MLHTASVGLAADYAWPLKEYSGCTSLFGDYRPGRYHAGLDLRTGGEEGWPVLAAGDGYVMRANTSYYGYGRGLYLKLDDGRIAVYGHLQRFGPEVTRRVRAEQRRLSRYNTNLYFDKDAIRVRKGMVIAHAGQTGAGAPHLHFELRTDQNKPLNPTLHGFPVTDRRDPKIEKLWLIPGHLDHRMGDGPNGPEPAHIPVSGSSRSPLRVASGTVYASGPVTFAVEAYDHKPNSSFRHNVTGLDLMVGSDTVFHAWLDTLVYETMDQSKLARLLWLDPGGDTYALFKSAGNRMAHSSTHPDYPGGIIQVEPGDSAVPLRIVVTDERGNRRTIQGSLTYRAPERSPGDPDSPAIEARARSIDLRLDRARGLAADLEARNLTSHVHSTHTEPVAVSRLFASDITDSVVWHEATDALLGYTTVLVLQPDREHDVWVADSSLHISVPAGAVYEAGFLTLNRTQGGDSVAVYEVGPADLLLKKSLTFSFTAPSDTLLSLWTVSASGDRLGFVEHRRNDGRISCAVGGATRYTFATDTIPPVVKRLRPASDAVVSADVSITAYVDDDQSGVGTDSLLIVRIDGAWIPPEYDPETNLLLARPFNRLKRGPHTLELEVYDWAGNKTYQTRRFRVK